MTRSQTITHLSHVALRVPDPEATAAYYKKVLGLGETSRDAATGAICLSALPDDYPVVPHHELVLYPGDGPAELDHIGLAVRDEAALNAMAASLAEQGIATEGPSSFESVHGPSLRLHDPDGRTIELLVPPAPVVRPAGDAPFAIAKLGHITMKSPDPARARSFWEQALGFRLSDQMGDIFFWMRCNRDHHAVAFTKHDAPGIHHIAWELTDWEQFKRMGDHFITVDAKIEYGPGRHGPGNNIFIYFLDPNDVRTELFCELARIDDEDSYKPGFWEAGSRGTTINRWGGAPPPPSYFTK